MGCEPLPHRDRTIVDKYSLVGFVGEYQDEGDSFNTYRPVLELDGLNRVPTSKRWTSADLVPIVGRGTQFINSLSSANEQLIEEGELIWLAGPGFYNRCRGLRGLEEYGYRFTSWAVKDAYRYDTGTLDEFETLCTGLLSDAKSHFHEALFRPDAAMDVSEASRYFEVFSGLSSWAVSDLFIELGLFLHQTRDFDGYELVASIQGQAADVPLSRAEFDGAVNERAEWLKDARLTESPAAKAIRTNKYVTGETTSNITIDQLAEALSMLNSLTGRGAFPRPDMAG